MSPTENRAWSAEAKRSNDGVVAAFVRDRVNSTLGYTSPSMDPTRSGPDDREGSVNLQVSEELAARIRASGRTADQLIGDALDREDAIRAMHPVAPAAMGQDAPESASDGQATDGAGGPE